MESPRLDQIIHQIDTPTSPSPEMFSFPGTPTDEQSQFEFGSCVTPDSPTMTTSSDVTKNNLVDDFSTTSPADQFFLNGRLLPHDFPVVHPASSSTRASFSGRENMGPGGATLTLSRGTSAGSNRSGSSSSGSGSGSQHSSKDYSLVSSKSNSTSSSRGSTCSTCARISSSEVSSERKTFQKRMNSVGEKSSVSNNNNNNSPLGKYYKFGASGSSQRWQFITAVPVLGPSQSRRGRRESGSGGTGTSPRMMRNVGSKEKRGGDSNNNNNNNGSFLYKILRSVVATCKACHAMEVQENEFELDATNVLGH